MEVNNFYQRSVCDINAAEIEDIAEGLQKPRSPTLITTPEDSDEDEVEEVDKKDNQQTYDTVSEKTSNVESNTQDVLFVKVELAEYEDESMPYLSSEDDIPVFPLDVQIAEGEEAEREDFEESPVKTELAGIVNEVDEEVVFCEDDFSKTHITVEPLPESYVDRVNEFLKVVTKQKLDGAEEINKDENINSQDEDSNAHFLTLQTRGKRKRQSNLTCESCSTVFRYQSTYNYHVKSQCGTRVIVETNQLVKKNSSETMTCNVCCKKMSSRTSLMVHMRIHNGERPFVCEVCNRSFTQKIHLKDHMKIHDEGRNPKPLIFTCPECGEIFNAKKYLQAHMGVHFGDKIFDCEVCHKRFRTRSNLSNHKIIHSNKKDFPCSICGKAFFRRVNLEEHIRVHTKEKPFACDICGKRFAERTRRNTHVKRHTGELKQVCSICDKKFACAYDLKVHQRMHTGEKPFACNICGRMFSRKVIMEAHMTIHTGRKDFVCTQCGEAFNRKSKLDVHVTNHTGEQFFCEFCHRVFKCRAYLIPHIRGHLGQPRRRSARTSRRKYRTAPLLYTQLSAGPKPTLLAKPDCHLSS